MYYWVSVPRLRVLHRVGHLDVDPEVQHPLLPARGGRPQPHVIRATHIATIIPHNKDFMSDNAQLQTSVQLFTCHPINIQTESVMAYR